MTDRSIAILPDRGLVEVQGPDAATFLHDLVTNNVENARPGTALFAGLLTPKGKIQFDFIIYRQGEEEFWIDCRKEQAGELAKRLMLYKLRAKITISDRSDHYAVGASWGEDHDWPIETGLESYADPRYDPVGRRFLLPTGYVWPDGIVISPGVAARYQKHRISLGVPEGGADYAYGEAFPHDACFEALHGVDFKKGCYIGQEVVSRMHHRGTAKTGIAIVEADEPLPETGTEITAGDRPAGRLGSVDGTGGIALLRLDRVEEAIASGAPVRAGGINIVVKPPPWTDDAQVLTDKRATE